MFRNAPLAAVVTALALSLGQLGCAGMFQRKAPESVEILNRQETANAVQVKHILIAWSWLAPSYRKAGIELDPRAEGRNQHDAEKLASDLLVRVNAGEPIEGLMREFSEDPGSAKSGIAYPVTPDSRMAPDFVELSLRLKPGEAGIVKSQFGLHVIQRVQ